MVHRVAQLARLAAARLVSLARRRPDGSPPNNWPSAFGGPAWTFEPGTSQWYYHAFYSQQPDLNWRNPAVEARMFATLKFWTDRGVDGFRLDAVNTLFEDPELRDNPTFAAPRLKLTGATTQEFVQTRGLPEVHAVLRRLRPPWRSGRLKRC